MSGKADVDGYRIVLTPLREEDGGGWMAEMPDIPGCMAAGDTLEETLALLQDAKESLIQVAKEDGEEIPEPIPSRYEFSGKFTLRMPKSLHRRLVLLAEAEGVSLNQYILYLLAGRSAGPRRPGARINTRIIEQQIEISVDDEEIARQWLQGIRGEDLVHLPSRRS